MKMKIDEELCTGHGRCAHFAPNVFRLDDDGTMPIAAVQSRSRRARNETPQWA